MLFRLRKTLSSSKYGAVFIVCIPKIRSLKCLFGPVFITGNKEDLERVSILTTTYGITNSTIQETIKHFDSEDYFNVWDRTDRNNLLRYIALDDYVGSGKVILCDHNSEYRYYCARIIISSVIVCGIVAIIIHDPSVLVFSPIPICCSWRYCHTSELAELREIYLCGDPNKVIENHKNAIKDREEKRKTQYDKYLQSKE